jgi:hypothetical protein
MSFNKNPFSEENIVADIYLALDQKNYQELYQILNRLPTFEPIIDLYFSFVEELRKHTYTMQQLSAIAQLLYRLSNFNFVDVESPKPFPINSIPSIANILRNRELKNSKKIDIKIKEIIKNLIKYYNIDIKRNNKYNNTNTGKLAIKLQNILLSFIIDYTRPESSEPLVVQSLFPPGATIANRTRYFEEHPEKMARIIGTKPI